MYSYTPHRSTTFPAQRTRSMNVRHGGVSVYPAHLHSMGNPGGMPGLGALLGVLISRTVYYVPYALIMAPFHKLETPANGQWWPTAATNPDDAPSIGGDTATPATVITPPKTDPASLTLEQARAMAEAQRKEIVAKYPARPWMAGFLGVGMTALGAYYGARMGAAPEDKDLAGRYAVIGGAGFSLLTMVGMALGAGRPEWSGGGALAAALGGYMAKGSGSLPRA